MFGIFYSAVRTNTGKQHKLTSPNIKHLLQHRIQTLQFYSILSKLLRVGFNIWRICLSCWNMQCLDTILKQILNFWVPNICLFFGACMKNTTVLIFLGFSSFGVFFIWNTFWIWVLAFLIIFQFVLAFRSLDLAFI